MNVAVPSYNNAAIFYPDATQDVGSFYKTIDAQTLMTFDYGAVLAPGVTITDIDGFYLNIQTNPQLIVSKGNIGGALTNQVNCIVSAGFGGITYDMYVGVTLSDTTIRYDVVHINVISPTTNSCNPGSIPAGYQQATLVPIGTPPVTVYGTGFLRYFVSPIPPTAPNLFDRWYNTSTTVISDYVTNGERSWWQSLYSLSVNLTSEVLYYLAEAGQFEFDTHTPDLFGNHYAITNILSLRVLVNGVRSMPQTPDASTGDYTVDVATSVVTFNQQLAANDVVIFDVVEII